MSTVTNPLTLAFDGVAVGDEIAVVLRAQPFMLVPDPRTGAPIGVPKFLRGNYLGHDAGIVRFDETTTDGIHLEWRLALAEVLAVALVGRVSVPERKLTLT